MTAPSAPAEPDDPLAPVTSGHGGGTPTAAPAVLALALAGLVQLNAERFEAAARAFFGDEFVIWDAR